MTAPPDTTTPELGSLLFAGKVVDDHFKVIRLIGKGGMSEVYLARDLKLGRKVALKVVHPEGLGSPEALERFVFEARTTALFNHPHIVTIYAVGEDKGRPYVALEYLEGQSLRQRLDEDRLSLGETLRIALAVAEALREAHRAGILHRDLKPENIIIPPDGRLRVLDFGLAKALAGSELERTVALQSGPTIPEGDATTDTLRVSDGYKTKAAGLRGTPAYMAPEQWRDDVTGQSTDLWAFGIVLHEMLAGRRPYTVTSIAAMAQKATSPEPVPLSLPADTPRPLCALLERCLEKDPRARPLAADAVACLEDLLHESRRAPADERNPFRGLQPFTERHARFFFGRDAEVAAFLERIRDEAVLPVVGPSGAGKSSFVQAGVLPRLREQAAWEVLRLRPGARPFLALASRLLGGESPTLGSGRTDSSPGEGRPPTGSGTTSSQAAEETLARELHELPSRLSLHLQRLAEEKRCRVLLFVDQIEELYTLVEDDEARRRFMEAVCTAAADAAEPGRVIFTLRDDYLGRVAEAAAARQALSRLTVIRAPGAEGLTQTLRCPVDAAGYSFDDDTLVPEMVQAVKDEPAALPLLQFATHLLWDRRDEQRRMLLRAAYEAMGGVAGALAEHADGVLAALSAAEVRLARDLLLRLCTAEGTRRALPRREALDGLGPEGGRVLDRLVEARLVSVRRAKRDDLGEPELELAHESLIQRWGRLRRWIDESRAELAMLAQVAQAAELWERRGRRDEELWQGHALAEAELVLRHSSATLPEPVQRFLAAGHGRARRRVKRLRAATLAVIALLAAGLLVLAHEKRVADREREQARQRWAEAQLEGARAAEAQHHPLEARAKLRGSLETRDSALGRALWRRLAEDPLLWRRTLGDSVTEISFAPDGKSVAAACRDRSIYVFDAHTMSLRRVLQDPSDQVFALAFSRDGQKLASGTRSGFLRLWDLERGTITGNLQAHSSSIWSLALDATGARLVSASDDGTVRTWDMPSLAPRRTLRGHRAGVYGVAFTPDGTRLITGSFDRTVRVWQEASGTAEATVEEHPARLYEVTVDPRGRFFAAAGADGKVSVFSMAQRKLVRLLPAHLQRVLSVAFSPDGELLASSSADQTIRLWRVGSWEEVRTLSGHTDWVRHIAFSPDGKRLASGSPDKSLRLWDLGATESPQSAGGHGDRVYGVAFTGGGSVLASAGADRKVRFWEVESGRSLGSLSGHADWVRCLAFSPDGRRLASGSSDASIRIWNTATKTEEQVLLGHASRVYGVEFSPDGERLASAGADGVVRLWRPGGGTSPRLLTGHVSAVKEVRFSPDGEQLASAGDDGSIRLWGLRGELKQVLRGHTEVVTGLAFLRDGNLASVSADGSVRLWDLEKSGEGSRGAVKGEGRVLAQEPVRLSAVAASPDGHRLAVAAGDGNLRLLDTRGGDPTLLRGHRAEVNGVAFSPDGRRLASASADGTVRVWSLDPPMPYWRAPGLLGSPPELLSQRGWSRLDSAARFDPPPAAWREAVRSRAVEASQAGDLLCLRSESSGLEIWDHRADRLLFKDRLPGLEQVLATDEGCLTRAGGRLRLYQRWGSFRDLLGDVAAMARAGRGLIAATLARVVELDASGAVVQGYPVGPGARSILQLGNRLAVGFENGTLALIQRGQRPSSPALLLRDAPSSAVVQLLEGPMSTLVVGYASGYVAIVNLEDGQRLDHVHVHGPVRDLRLEQGKLYVVSELGDHAVLDLRFLQASLCEVLRSVWQRVPVIWEKGQPVLRERPVDHPCARAP
jgi:WD40 repeat protein/serine/threonine protein kinase